MSHAPDARDALGIDDDPDWIDQNPEPGDTAIINNQPQILLHVVAEHILPAGEIVKAGQTVAEQLGVAADRDVVLCVQLSDLVACPREFETHADILDAVDEAAVIPDPYPVSLIAPLPEEIREKMARVMTE